MRPRFQSQGPTFSGSQRLQPPAFPGSVKLALANHLAKTGLWLSGPACSMLATTGLTHATPLIDLDVSLFLSFFEEPISRPLRGTEPYVAPCEQ